VRTNLPPVIELPDLLAPCVRRRTCHLHSEVILQVHFPHVRREKRNPRTYVDSGGAVALPDPAPTLAIKL
jgi:hypothetical protein